MTISVFLADDSVLVREGVQALVESADDLEVVGVAGDYDGLVDGAIATEPRVVVTDICMPPCYRDEGIAGAKIVRMRHPGTGVVVLSQYDDPEFAVALLSEGAAGYAYLLKDRVAHGDQLRRAIREVATGGSFLDPKIVEALTAPVTAGASLTAAEERLLDKVAEGMPIKAIATWLRTTPADADARVEKLFVRLAGSVAAGDTVALQRLRDLRQAIADREEQGDELSRLLPPQVVAWMVDGGGRIGETVEVEVTVLISDIRGYSEIAQHAKPAALSVQLNEHRTAMEQVIVDHGGTMMQFVGDAVMAVFGAPAPLADYAGSAVAAASAMHQTQASLNAEWRRRGLEAFALGIGVSTGPVAAALLGSDERAEYTVVGDSVNLAQRLQQWGEPGDTVLSQSTYVALDAPPPSDLLGPATVKGREKPVLAHRFPMRRAS